MTGSDIVLEIRHISKKLGGRDILTDCSTTVARGEMKVLIGPSGAGKSTLLQCINCLIMPDSGEILLEGKKLDTSSKQALCAYRAQVGMIFQDFNLFDHLSAIDNVTIALRKVKGMDKKAAKERGMEELTRVGLASKYQLYPAQLSGGQKQRVAIARAIVSEPEVLLLDEPLSNLDAKLRIEMRSEIKRLHQELGTTIIYVTHDQTEALTMSTKIAIFFEGVLEQVAPPMELYQNPASLRVADFIGNPKVNFLPGKARVAGDTMTVESVLGTASYDRKSFTGEAPGDGSFEAVVGVRPELVEILDGPAEGSIEAEVYSVMPAGSETTIYLEVGGERILSKQNGLKQYSPDQKVWLRINPDKMNVFCKDSGRLAKLAVMDAQQDQQNSNK